MKIKYDCLKELIKCTNKEIECYLYIARFQDYYGHVTGIYYGDVCKATGISKQTFYNVLRSLKNKGIIAYTHSDQNHNFDITILNNDFSYPESFKEGYIDLSRKIFHTSQFKKLKAREKVLLLLFLKVTHENSSSYQIDAKKFYDQYTDLFGVTERVLRGYLHSLKQFFSIGIKNGQYSITFLDSISNHQKEVNKESSIVTVIKRVIDDLKATRYNGTYFYSYADIAVKYELSVSNIQQIAELENLTRRKKIK